MGVSKNVIESARESAETNENSIIPLQETNQGGNLEDNQINIPQLNYQTSSNLNNSKGRSQYSVSEMFELAKQNMYPKKCI